MSPTRRVARSLWATTTSISSTLAIIAGMTIELTRFIAALPAKLTGEARQAAAAPVNGLLTELADVCEVLPALASDCGTEPPGRWPEPGRAGTKVAWRSRRTGFAAQRS